MKQEPMYQTPDIPVLEGELRRAQYKKRYAKVLRSTVYALVVVAALAVLVATLWTPVLRIYGSSMTPTLAEGQYVVSIKGLDFEQGDLVSFYIGNKLLVKRVIGIPGDWIDIREDGTVFVNDQQLDEPYVDAKALGQCDIELPYQVPESSYFLMGDHRESSVDSRSSSVGCVSKDQIVGKIVFCIWPLSEMGGIG
jgi:signal peptidase I